MHLHLITHHLSVPPFDGEAMDTFYLLQGLQAEGIKVNIHVFSHNRENDHPGDLFRYVEELFVYPKRTLSRTLPRRYPHLVSAHNHNGLLDRLLMDDLPLLFAGFGSTYFLSHPAFEARVKLVRLHRIEWEYYHQRAQYEPSFWQRRYLQAESRQLQDFEQTLSYADYLLPLSPKDQDYYDQRHPQSHYLPPFHPFEKVSSRTGRGQFCLYHGNLGRLENHQAAMFLVESVFDGLDLPLIVAGANPQPDLISVISERDHVVLKPNPGVGELTDLLHHAQIHVLPSFQSSGLPLKLINSLFTGRFVVVNPAMVFRTGLEFGTHVAHDPEDMRRMIFDLWHQEFSDIDIAQRKAALNGLFSNQRNARKVVELIRRG